MKRKSFMGAVVVGAFLVVFAGVSQAGAHQSFTEFGENGPSPEYWEAIGAGSVSSGGERHAMESASREFSFSESGENGPDLEYWEAVETGSLSGADDGNRLLDTGVDPSRWEGPTQ